MAAKLYGTLIAACCLAGCDHASSQTLDRSDAAAHSDSGHAEHSDANSLTRFEPNLTGLQQDLEVSVDGRVRTFHFFVPSGLDDQATYPVVVLLHGHGGSSDQLLGLDGRASPHSVWLDVAQREKIILLVPEGVVSPDGKLGWNDCRTDGGSTPSTDDVGLIRALLDGVSSSYPVDTNRVYATGTSNGGLLAFRLGIEAGDRFAAIAPVVASMPVNSECGDPDRSVALMLMNGTADAIMPYDGGVVANGRGEVLSTLDTVRVWLESNQNRATASVETLPDIDPADRSTIVTTSYLGETRLQDVVLVSMQGAGHTEPSIAQQYNRLAERILGVQNHDLEMAEWVWAFFSDKRR